MMTCNEMEAEMLRLKNVPCMDCVAEGHNGIWPVCAMQFDHVRGEKVSTVRACISVGNEEIFRAEMAKCDIVCANHHAIRTSSRKRSPESLKRMSEAQKIAQNNPEFKAKKSAAITKGMANSRHKAAQADRMRNRWNDPEFRKKYSVSRQKTESENKMKRLLTKFDRKTWMKTLLGKDNE